MVMSAFATTMTDPADAPDDVLGLELMARDGMIAVMWDETTDNGSPVTGLHSGVQDVRRSGQQVQDVSGWGKGE